MNLRHLFLGLMTASVLSGCALMADPREIRFDELGSVEQFQLNDSTFKMNFISHTSSSRIDPEEVALIHAAQLTLTHGFQYFKIQNPVAQQPAAPVRSVIVAPPVFQLGYGLGHYRHGRHGYWNANFPIFNYGGWYGYNSPYGFDGIYNHEYYPDTRNSKISYTIECAKQMNTAADMFDAHIILKTLGPKFGLNKEVSAVQPTQPTAK